MFPLPTYFVQNPTHKNVCHFVIQHKYGLLGET